MDRFPATDEDGFTLADAVRLAGVSRETGARIERYVAALDEWRTKLNLIGPGEGKHLWRRHVYDSLQLVPLIREEERSIADLGSGAGFPGIILACAFPDRDVALVEKSPKKSEFLRAAVLAAGVRAEVLTQRAEDPVSKRYDLVTSRALSPLPKLLGQAYPWLTGVGRSLFVKGRGASSELALARESWDFEAIPHESQTNPEGQILAVSGLRPKKAG
jgi:16S rRNA (guanine527-N7)-methyltransferase